MSLARHRQPLHVARARVQQEIARGGGEEGDGEGEDVGGGCWVDIWDLRAEGMRSSGAAKGGVRAVREVAFIWTEVEDDDGVGGWLWAEEKSAKRGS